MASFNRVVLMGNLTRDPELRYLPSNTPVVNFGLAINRRYRNQQGEQQEEVTFVDCEAFGKPADIINQYCSKGKPLLIEGRLRLDQWQDRDGNNRSKLKVVVENFQFIDAGRGDGGAAGPRGATAGAGGGRQSDSSGSSRAAGEPPHQSIPEDDIPF